MSPKRERSPRRGLSERVAPTEPLGIFLVPVARGASGFTYEAVFT